MAKKGFIGYILRSANNPIGFSWGYQIPRDGRTKSVDFPTLIPLIENKGLDISKTFYGAELGIIDSYQGKGIGGLISTYRLNQARLEGYNDLLVRTKNERVLSILRKMFSNEKEDKLFIDPEKQAPWFRWSFENFDLAKAEKKLRCLT